MLNQLVNTARSPQARFLIVASLLGGLAGCSIDDRALGTEGGAGDGGSAGQGGGKAGAGGAGGGGGVGGTGGAGGAGGSGGGGVDGGTDGARALCGGAGGATCPPSYFCELPTGACKSADAQGRCELISVRCTLIYAPVCGCDGKTYGNDCERRGNAVQKEHDGECAGGKVVGKEGDVCGGLLPPGAPVVVCGAGLFCEHPAGTCLLADQPGRCAPRSATCPGIYAPVCGCDGKTYESDCIRRSVAAQKAHDGACPSGGGKVGDRCGGIAGLGCMKGLYCEPPAGMCGSADIFGTCQMLPTGCTKEVRPVCGCNAVTYPNDCMRRQAQVGKAHDGECAGALLPAGRWGGEHAALYAEDPAAGAKLEFDCAVGAISGALVVARPGGGDFKWRGTYTVLRGGPEPPGVPPDVRGAVYWGAIDGTSMKLYISVEGLAEIGPYALVLGAEPRLFRCQ